MLKTLISKASGGAWTKESPDQISDHVEPIESSAKTVAIRSSYLTTIGCYFQKYFKYEICMSYLD